MCHASCLTCEGQNFSECLSCVSGQTLINGACFCDLNWDSSCVSVSIFQNVYQMYDMIFIAIFSFLILMYVLKVNLRYSYRILLGLQGLSIMIYSSKIYLAFENFYALKILAKSNGFYSLNNRIESLSFQYSLPTMVLFCCFLLGLFLMYSPIKTFKKDYESYKQYLFFNIYDFLSYFYMFGSKLMFFFIGMWIKNITAEASVLIPFLFYSIVILIVLIKTFYDYRKDTLDYSIYEPQLYLYCVLSPSAMMGLPMAQSSILYVPIYLAPLGGLLLIIILSKDFNICCKDNILFYVVECLMGAFISTFIVVSGQAKSVILFGGISLFMLLIVVQMIHLLYSGTNMKNNKVYPEQRSQAKSIKEDEEKENKDKRKKKKASNYF